MGCLLQFQCLGDGFGGEIGHNRLAQHGQQSQKCEITVVLCLDKPAADLLLHEKLLFERLAEVSELLDHILVDKIVERQRQPGCDEQLSSVALEERADGRKYRHLVKFCMF